MKQVILIVFDSVRPDHLSCYGYQRNTTPNIDKIAEFGTMYEAEANGLGTRGAAFSILSGQKTFLLNDDRCPVLDKFVLLQQMTHSSMFGSNQLLFFSALGWDVGWKYHYLMEAHPPLFRPAKRIIDEWFLYNWLELKPCFSLLWFNETHGPYKPDSSWETFYNDDFPIKEGEVVFFDPTFEKEFGHDFAKSTAYYDGAIHYLDSVIKPILELASDDVLLIITSDHGDFIGEYGHWFTHGIRDITLEQAQMVLKHVFLVISQPANKNLATHIDITATIVDWLNITKPSWYEGKTLLMCSQGSRGAREQGSMGADEPKSSPAHLHGSGSASGSEPRRETVNQIGKKLTRTLAHQHT